MGDRLDSDAATSQQGEEDETEEASQFTDYFHEEDDHHHSSSIKHIFEDMCYSSDVLQPMSALSY